MIEVQQCCEPSTFDFGLPPDFLVDDDALELAALSEHIFSDTPFLFPVDEPSVRPLRSVGGSSGSEGASAGPQQQQMVPLHGLHAGLECSPPPLRGAASGSASPATSGEGSYKPAFDAGGSSGSEFTESRQQSCAKATSTSAAGDGTKASSAFEQAVRPFTCQIRQVSHGCQPDSV